MLLVRALNDLDIQVNPLENGIASKQLIYKIVRNYYEKGNDSKYHSLSREEKELFIKEHMEEYLREHSNKLKNKFLKSTNQAREDVREFCEFNRIVKSKTKEELLEAIMDNKEKLHFGSYIAFMTYLSSLQQHLLYGSSKITDWISFSTNLDNIMRYYHQQDIHKVAVIRSNTGGLVDSDYILSVDLSSFERVREQKCLCNRIDINENILDVVSGLATIDPGLAVNFNYRIVNHTSSNSRGFKYANASKEVCILKYVPRDHVVSVLEAIQIDLLKMGRFNQDFFKLSKEDQKKQLEILKKALYFEVINQEDPDLRHIFEELYLKNKNVRSIINMHDSPERINHNRSKILYLAKTIPNIQIKR